MAINANSRNMYRTFHFQGIDWVTINPELLGYIPQMIDAGLSMPITEQINHNYAHGGGWRPFKGFDLSRDLESPLKTRITYPGDPPYYAHSYGTMTDTNNKRHHIYVFPHSWVCIVDDGGKYEICRMD